MRRHDRVKPETAVGAETHRRFDCRWEKADDGTNYTTDFDLTYMRAE
jgi:hypothetical protein